MANAIFHLQHGTIGKATHAPGTARAHAHYILRRSACGKVVSVNFSTNPHAIKREVEALEEGIRRKNGRIADKVMFALPQCMTVEQRVETVRKFVWQLTDGGRSRAFASIHDLTGEKPHVHVFLVDRDRDGRPVAMLSASPRDRARAGFDIANGTEWLRDLWEKSCNRRLEEYGYDHRIDRRARLELEKDGDADADAGLAPSRPEAPLEAEAPSVTLADDPHPTEEADMADRQEPEEAATIVREGTGEPRTVPARVRAALDHHRHLVYIEDIEQQIAAARALHEQASQEVAANADLQGKAALAVGMAEQATSRFGENMALHLTGRGRMRGFSVGLGRWRWASPARRAAEQAAAQLQQAERLAASARDAESALRHEARLLDMREQALRERVSAKTHELERTGRQVVGEKAGEHLRRTHGEEAEIAEAKAILTRSRDRELREVSGPDILAAYEADELSAEEAAIAAELAGDQVVAAEIANRREHERDDDTSL